MADHALADLASALCGELITACRLRRPPGRQLRFVARIVELVPRLLDALNAGHVAASQKIRQWKLSDGKTVELWLVANVPKRDRTPLVRGQK